MAVEFIVTETGEQIVDEFGVEVVDGIEAPPPIPIPPQPRRVLITRRDWVAEDMTTFSLGAWVTPFSTLSDPRPQVVLRALSPEPEDTRFQVDFGVQRNNVGLFHFQNLRVTALATLRVRASLEPDMVTPTYDSGVVSAWPVDKPQLSTNVWGEFTISGTYEPEEYTALGMPRFLIPPAPVQARYVRVNISDTTAAVPAMIGTFGACEVWEPEHAFNYGWSVTYIDESDVTSMPYGSRYFISRGKRRRLSLGFSFLQLPQMTSIVMGWVPMVGKSRPIVIAPFPDDAPHLEKRAVYGTITDNVVVTNPFYANYEMPITLEQLI